MTDCGSIHGSTSSSSDAVSSRSGVITSRIRIVRMIRPSSKRLILGPETNAAFGFAIRGGKEFGTGFFVSRIEKGSEADLKGLRIGDQIVRVNGYQVDDAVHKELSQFISSQCRLTMKVRGVGMLPMKERNIDPLTWHMVPHHVLNSLTNFDEITPKDVRIVLKVAPKTKLGLGICKGPEWKPGIFVQFTKDFSVARDAGLRPGDQILSCNSIDFSDVLFSEAVAVMKSSHTLEMTIRTAAGLDLFPGESSGYNSSASSITGDQSPCWADQSSKRFNMSRQENGVDRLNGYNRRWNDRINLDRRKDHIRQADSLKKANDENKTIIQLSESGTMINNTLVQEGNKNLDKQNHNSHSSLANFNLKSPENQCFSSNSKIADICFVSRQSETKTVIVEVHRGPEKKEEPLTPTNTTSTSNSVGVPPPPPPQIPSALDNNEKRFCNSGLSNAISEELKKRQQRKQISECNNQNTDLVGKQQQQRFSNPSPSGNDDNQQRHKSLMDEFRRAHQKMFKNGFQETEQQKERQADLSKVVVAKDEVDHEAKDRHLTELQMKTQIAPPPPEFANDSEPSHKYNCSFRLNNFVGDELPQTPTPDYDSTPCSTLTKTSPFNSSSSIPRPPSLYLVPQNSGSPTIKKQTKNVVVTIGEYGVQNGRKEPSKFDFITKGQENNSINSTKDVDVSNMLRSELEKTLSRSNLKKRNDMDANLNGNYQKDLTKNLTKEKPILQKTQSSNIEKLTSMLQRRMSCSETNNNLNSCEINKNRVSINIPMKDETRKTENTITNPSPLNGILKNGLIKSNLGTEKNITFGN